jgi:hypothetical protein
MRNYFCLFVIGAFGSIERLDELFLDDSPSLFWDEPLEETTTNVVVDPVRLPVGWVGETSSAGLRCQVPYSYRRDVKISASAEYAAALRDILTRGFVPSLNDMFRFGGAMKAKDIRYKSLHNAVRNFRRRLEVSSVALQAMLDLKREEGTAVTAPVFWKRHRLVIQSVDPHCSSRRDLLVWHRFVVDCATGIRVEDLEVEQYLSSDGYVVYRPVGSALKRMVEFELGRIRI